MAVHGKNAYVALGNASGTPTPLTGIGKESGLSETADTAETTHYGLTDKTYIMGHGDATASVNGNFDATVATWLREAFQALKSGEVASLPYVYGPEGNDTGKPSYSQEVLITSLDISSPVGDLVSISMSLQRTGPTTDDTF